MYDLADRWRTLAPKRASTVLTSLLDTLIPPVCALCRTPGKLLCDACLHDLPRVGTPYCQRCGRPSQQSRAACHSCRPEALPLQQIRAPLLYDQMVPKLMHQFKYKHKHRLADLFGALMIEVWPDLSLDCDFIVPLPLHPSRLRGRGYNQAALLANVVGAGVDRPVVANAMQRIKATAPQAKLSTDARQANTADAFAADPKLVSQQQILLIDDVCTTGATLSSAAQALFAAGAHTVVGLCAARAP